MLNAILKCTILCCCIIVFWNCVNPFAPKLDMENAGVGCDDLTIIENLFCTFKNAYTFKDTTLYSSIIAPDFMFIYRDYDRGVDVSWGRYEEMRATQSLFQNAQSLVLTWNNKIFADSTDTTYSSIRGFNLTITFNPSDVIYIDGYANLTFTRKENNSRWYITRWRDESNF